MKNFIGINRNLSVHRLISASLESKETILTSRGALVVYTGKYTGRSPMDKFIVDTLPIHNKINWGKVNIPISSKHYHSLLLKMKKFFNKLDKYYIYEGIAGADPKYCLKVKIISEFAYQSLFANHLLRRVKDNKNYAKTPSLKVFCAPSCLADPEENGTNSEVFIVINFEKMVALIGGTKYAGEIKKAIFTVMNYLLPEKSVLPMHCSANVNKKGETALFFGLSGTGKTTLSADPERILIGDDEHGWSENGIFNFEGGCYAKCINLKKESEPQIWNAIKHGALIENVEIGKNGDLDFSSSRFTENTRVAYPLNYIDSIVPDGMGKHPKYVIFLTADAFGVLPPVAKLTIKQAIYYFLLGYTSKLAGTEREIIEPKITFSPCFGAPFMPRSPLIYASLLEKKLLFHKSQVYLVNTGWQGGPYGIGKRISIKTSRLIVKNILSGNLDKLSYIKNKLFNLSIPRNIKDLSPSSLKPRNSWKNKNSYDIKAHELSRQFKENYYNFYRKVNRSSQNSIIYVN